MCREMPPLYRGADTVVPRGIFSRLCRIGIVPPYNPESPEILQVFVRILIPVALLAAGWFGYSLLSVEEEEKMRPKPEPRVIKTRVIELEKMDFQTVAKHKDIYAILRPRKTRKSQTSTKLCLRART